MKSVGSALAAHQARRLPLPAVRVPFVSGERDFRRFWAGETVSLFDDRIALIALPLVAVLVLHASAAQMGYLGAAALVPNLLFSLHAGARVDRRGRRRRAMIVTAVGRAALLATIPVAYAFGALTLTQLYVVGFLVGALSVFFYGSYSTLFVSLVPRERYLEAGSDGVRPIGSLVGGLLGAWIGLRTTLWIGCVGAIAGVLWLLPSPLMRMRELPEVAE